MRMAKAAVDGLLIVLLGLPFFERYFVERGNKNEIPNSQGRDATCVWVKCRTLDTAWFSGEGAVR